MLSSVWGAVDVASGAAALCFGGAFVSSLWEEHKIMMIICYQNTLDS